MLINIMMQLNSKPFSQSLETEPDKTRRLILLGGPALLAVAGCGNQVTDTLGGNISPRLNNRSSLPENSNISD